MAYVNLGQVIYPVGSIYMSTKNISPGDMFGGVWEEIKDERFWLAVSLSKTVDKQVETNPITICQHIVHATLG